MNSSYRVGFVFGMIALLAMLGCPPGTKTSAEFHVTVSADACKEDRTGPAEPEFVMLECPKVEGGGVIRVQFPRREWWNMRAHDARTDAGPGK